jgi:hypothetical protein
MVRETIGGSAFRVKNPATAKKDKAMDAIDKASIKQSIDQRFIESR